MTQAETSRIAQTYDRLAPAYDSGMRLADRLLFGDGRQWICVRATGRILEIAIGSGRNIPFYRAGVRLIGIDLSRGMLAAAAHRAADAPFPVDLLRGDAQSLPFADASFDTVVICLALCTIPDERRAIDEAIRVLRPGGRLLWLEHIGSHLAPVRLAQRLLEPSSLRRLSDHLTREPSKYLASTPLTVEEREVYRLGAVERLSASKSASPGERDGGPLASAVVSPARE